MKFHEVPLTALQYSQSSDFRAYEHWLAARPSLATFSAYVLADYKHGPEIEYLPSVRMPAPAINLTISTSTDSLNGSASRLNNICSF